MLSLQTIAGRSCPCAPGHSKVRNSLLIPCSRSKIAEFGHKSWISTSKRENSLLISLFLGCGLETVDRNRFSRRLSPRGSNLLP